MTFARKLLLGLQGPGDCIFTTEEQTQGINRIIGAVNRKREPQSPPDSEIVEIHPCTEEGMVTLWAQFKPTCGSIEHLGDYFDQIQLCRSVKQADFFDKDECSPRMGYAYVELKGKRAHIFKTGKIIMRRADNKDDAMATLSKISRLLLPARVCSCGNLMADCFGGCCDDCSESTCQSFSERQDESRFKDGGGTTTIGDIILERMEEQDEDLNNNYTLLNSMFQHVRGVVDAKRSDTSLDYENLTNKMSEYEGKLVKVCTREFLGAGKPENIVIALTQYGLARDLLRAIEGLFSLEGGRDEALFVEVTGLLLDAYSAFEKRDDSALNEIKKRYGAFISDWDRNPQKVGYAKIAANGFYISRILGKPVSDLSMFDPDKDIV